MPTKKKIAVFYYDFFAEFEVALALTFLANHEIIAVALEQRAYGTLAGERLLADHLLADVDPATLDLFIIPGGDPRPFLDHDVLREYITKVAAHSGIIAGICGGADILVGLNFLEGKRCTGNADDPDNPPLLKAAYEKTFWSDEPVVRDGAFITAQGPSFVDFAYFLGGLYGMTREDFPAAAVAWIDGKDGWTHVSGSVHVSQSTFEECNMTLVVSAGEAVLVDTGYRQPEARRVLDYLEENHLKLTNIIITHHHEDHDANLGLFPMNHETVHDPATVGSGIDLKVGNLTLKLFPTPGHHYPPGDISVAVVNENILIAGDILYSCLPPQLCYRADADVLIATLKRIAAAHYRWIVPGHGRVMSGEAMTTMALAYIDKLYARVSAVVDAGGGEDDLYAIKLYDCIAHPDWMVEEPAIDLHRQNKAELFARMQKKV